MHFSYLLRLVNDRSGEQLRAFNKDPDWPGWIPVQSFGPAIVNVAHTVSAASAGGADKGTTLFAQNEVRFQTKADDLDFVTLNQWFVNGETMSAKMSFVPAAVGDEGFQYVFDGALLSSFLPYPPVIQFTLNYQTVERRFLMRFR